MPPLSAETQSEISDDIDAQERRSRSSIAMLLRLRERGIRDTRLLNALERVPRDHFAPQRYADLARRGLSVPLPCGQTMTSTLALLAMIDTLTVERQHRVLEIGTGSGFGTALLARLCREVVSLERYATLALAARECLATLDTPPRGSAIAIHQADGLRASALGTFDRVIVNGWVATAPDALLSLLNPRGRLVAVLGEAGDTRIASVILDVAGRPAMHPREPLRLSAIRSGLALAS